MSSESHCLCVDPNGNHCQGKSIDGTDFCNICSKNEHSDQREISKIFWKINKGNNIEYPLLKYQIATTITQVKFEKETTRGKIVEMESQIAICHFNMERIKMDLEKFQICLNSFKEYENKLTEHLNSILQQYVDSPIGTSDRQNDDSSNPENPPEILQDISQEVSAHSKPKLISQGVILDRPMYHETPPDLFFSQPSHYYVDCTDSDCKLEVIEDLLGRLNYNKCIIFVDTHYFGCGVYNKLGESQNLNLKKIHLDTCWGCIVDSQKEIIWKSFLSKTNSNSVLITSDSDFSRNFDLSNFDLSNINLIINYNVTKYPTTYITRAKYLRPEKDKKKIVISLVEKKSGENISMIGIKTINPKELPDCLDELL